MINLAVLQKLIAQLSKREKTVLYASLVFISLAILDRAVIAPALGKMEDIDKQVKVVKLMIKKDLHFLSFRERITKEAAQYASYFIEEKSPEEEIKDLLKLLESFASNAKVYLIFIKPAGFKSEEKQTRYYIDLSCEGEMARVLEFIYNIESSDKLMNVAKFNILPKADGTAKVQCRLTVVKIGLL